MNEIPLDNPKRLKDLIPFLKSPILEVGSNKGYDTKYFTGQGYDVWGLELDKEFVKEARKTYPKLIFFNRDFVKQPLSRKFATLLALDVLEHNLEAEKFLVNCRKCLKKEGTLVLTFPNVLGLRYRLQFLRGDSSYLRYSFPNHVRFFSVDSINFMLNEAGFKVVKVFGYSSIPFLPTSLCGSLTVVAEKRD